MKIETPHEIGDVFWYIKLGKAKSFTVGSIHVYIGTVPMILSNQYTALEDGNVTVFDHNFFPTKEALLASL